VKSAPNPREPLLTTPLPKHPWERVGADLFQLNVSTYLLVVDYSRYPEVIKLSSTTSKTDITQTSSHLTSQWHFLPDFRQKDKEFKEKQKRNYDHRHHVTPADTLPDDSSVWMTTGNSQTPERVVSNAGTAKSYLVNTPSGPVHRNRQHLNHRLSRTDGNTSNIPDIPTTTPTQRAEPEETKS